MAAPHLNDSSCPDRPALREAKRALRQHVSLLRRPGHGDAALIASILAHVRLNGGEIVAGVWPLPGEPDLRPLWHLLHRRGHRILLPQTPPRGEALRFWPWQPGCAMIAGRFGTLHPADGLPVVPEVMFVPFLAFDREGYRLGYGGGYYDRTLAALPGVRAVGYGFSFQQVDAVPRGPFDLPLSCIVTEKGRVFLER